MWLKFNSNIINVCNLVIDLQKNSLRAKMIIKRLSDSEIEKFNIIN